MRNIFSIIIAFALVFLIGGVRAADSPKQIRIIYTSDTRGYLEPCGCGGLYEGGLARRATAIRRLLKFTPNALILDSGSITDRPSKLDPTLSIMADLKYESIGIGQSDAAYSDKLIGAAKSHNIKVIDTLHPGSADTVPVLIEPISGFGIAVVSFGSNGPPSPNYMDTYKKARQSCDILILLDQAGIATKKWLETNAKIAPDVVIGGPASTVITQHQIIGKTCVLPASMLGRRLGVLDIDILPNGTLKFDSQLILINQNTAEDEAIKSQINSYLLSSKAKDNQITPNGVYYSPRMCKSCHQQEYAAWRKNKHASAVRTLANRNRMVSDCLPCHSEEYRRKGDVTLSPDEFPMGIECATCHANVIPHTRPDGPPAAKRQKVSAAVCLDCHDPNRSPNFDAKTYMAKISHQMGRKQNNRKIK